MANETMQVNTVKTHDLRKMLPLWSVLIFLVICGGLYLLYQNNLDPTVIQAQATLAEKNATLWTSQKPIFDALPSVLVSGAYLAVAIGAGIGLIMILGSIATAIFGSTVNRVVNNGIGYVKETPNGTNKIYIAPPNTVVAAHLGRLLGPGGSDRPVLDGKSADRRPSVLDLQRANAKNSGRPGSEQPPIRPQDNHGRVGGRGNGTANGHSGPDPKTIEGFEFVQTLGGFPGFDPDTSKD